MRCTYFYNGKKFDNEAQLNDFLYEVEPLKSTYGDLVFSKTPEQLERLKMVDDQLDRILKDEANHRIRRLSAEEVKEVTEDSDTQYAVEIPNTGVSSFMKTIRKRDNHLAFPDMVRKNYFGERYKDWVEGRFNPQEEKDFFGTGPTKKIPKDELEDYSKIIETKWEAMHEFGTEIHRVLQLFFSKTKDGKEIRKFSDKFLIDTYFGSGINAVNNELVSKQALTSLIAYARNLERELITKYGEDAKFYPEYKVTAFTNQVDDNGLPIKLLGVIDLLILDKDYKAHFIDYKTSDKPYEQFSNSKKLTYSYQFSIYDRLLRTNGIEMADTDVVSVAPIQMTDFYRDNNDKWKFTDIKWEHPRNALNKEDPGRVLQDITKNTLEDNNIISTVQLFLPYSTPVSVMGKNLEDKLLDFMKKAYPDSESTVDQNMNTCKHLFEKHSSVDKETGKIILDWKSYDGKEPKPFDTEGEAISFIMESLENSKANLHNYTNTMFASYKTAQEEDSNAGTYQFKNNSQIIENKEHGSAMWLNPFLNKYTIKDWEVLPEYKELTSLGILVFKNKYSQRVDIIKFTTRPTKETIKAGKYNATTLLANFRSDTEERSNTNSKALGLVRGNVELMEVMFALNNLGKLPNDAAKIGTIQVVNPHLNSALSANNDELLYNFNELSKYVDVGLNSFTNDGIKFMTHFDMTRARLMETVNEATFEDKAYTYKGIYAFKSKISEFDKPFVDKEEKLKVLNDLLKELVDKYGINIKAVHADEVNYETHPELSVYNELMLAIAELKGYSFRQQLSDNDMYYNGHISKLRGTYIDNPGNLGSQTLNVVTSMVLQAYQNVREELDRNRHDVILAVEALKKEKQFTYFGKEIFMGNQVNLYKNMLEFKNGDITIKHPDDPTIMGPAEKNFIELFLKEVNRRRYGSNYEDFKDKEEYYQIPITRGGNNSNAAINGTIKAFKNMLAEYFIPKKAIERIKAKLEGVYDEDMDKQMSGRQEIWEMTNSFDRGFDQVTRLKTIQNVKIPELNLETLLLKYEIADSLKTNLDAVFPIIKASMIHLVTMGELQNDKFANDIQYLQDYVKNKIFNRSLIKDNERTINETIRMVMQKASDLCLKFSPVQFPYQMLDGIFKDVSLMIRKPDLKDPNGKSAFTFKNIKDSYLSVLKNLVTPNNRRTIEAALNELYGLNDMDMNTLAEHLKSDNHGFWSFWSTFAFKFVSRPDFYNRLTIFGAQMRGDGCWKAHKMVDGKLVYDWKLDDRFSLFSKGAQGKAENLEEYNRQKGLYISMAKQMVIEHTKNADGSDFIFDPSRLETNPIALPKAYTTQQSEGYKSLSDKLYGYYAHEKKSMIHSLAVGAAMMQMKTYWSGKKNQYLAPGGIYISGKMEQYSEKVAKVDADGKPITDADGNAVMEDKKFWVKLNSDGTIDDMPTTDSSSGIPYMKWKGQWEEGVVSTLMTFYQVFREGSTAGDFGDRKNIIINKLWNNPDENLRTAYRANIKQLGFDVMMIAFVGGLTTSFFASLLADSKVINKKDKTLSSAMYTNGLDFMYRTIKNASDDANMVKSISGIFTQATPFAVTYFLNIGKSWSDLLSGDSSLEQAALNTSAFTKQTKYLINYFIDPNNPQDTKWSR